MDLPFYLKLFMNRFYNSWSSVICVHVYSLDIQEGNKLFCLFKDERGLWLWFEPLSSSTCMEVPKLCHSDHKSKGFLELVIAN